MDINIDVRSKQLENLEQFISSSKKKLNMILKTLNWTEDKVREDSNLVSCSQDTNHRVPAQCLELHTNNCRLKMLGYDLNGEFLSEPLHHSSASIIIDNQKKREILSQARRNIHNFKSGWNGVDPDPMTADRSITTFTSDERLALYNYAKEATTGPPVLPEFNVSQPAFVNNKELTYEERLEQERNAKRRRIKYKTVHTSHKSHKEVIRDVINNQMEAYQEWLKEKEPKIKIEQAESDSSNEESCSYSHNTVKSDDLRNNRLLMTESDVYHNRKESNGSRNRIESKEHHNYQAESNDICDYRMKPKLQHEDERNKPIVKTEVFHNDKDESNDFNYCNEVFQSKNEHRRRSRAGSNDYHNKNKDGTDYRHRSRPKFDEYRIKSGEVVRHSKETIDDFRNRSSSHRRNENYRSREQSYDSGNRQYTKRKSDNREERRYQERGYKKSRRNSNRR